MATEKHKKCSSYIKTIHKNLRRSAHEIGADLAWSQHINHINDLRQYSEAMNSLSECWHTNLVCNEPLNDRIKWSVNYCLNYFDLNSNIINQQRERERRILESVQKKIVNTSSTDVSFDVNKLKLLDVGSCNNPFNQYSNFDVMAIDLFPANITVLKCDFLNIKITDGDCSKNSGLFLKNDYSTINCLPKNHFDVIVFSLLLEYLPASNQRKVCCANAYDLLKYEGLLLIITPDSKHTGANAKLMKNWQYTLAIMGFSRIKYEKFKHISCMAFRKAIDKIVTKRWAEIHKTSDMTDDLFIPQDFNDSTELKEDIKGCEAKTSDSVENLKYLLELPELNLFD